MVLYHPTKSFTKELSFVLYRQTIFLTKHICIQVFQFHIFTIYGVRFFVDYNTRNVYRNKGSQANRERTFHSFIENQSVYSFLN